MGEWGKKVECKCCQCGAVFMLSQSTVKVKNYCSNECKEAANSVPCYCCGKLLKIKPSYRKVKNYCSDECKEKARANCKCDYCGNSFYTRWKNKKNYCSEQCKEKASYNCVCEYCGKKLYKKKHRIKNHTFCNLECWKKSISIHKPTICPNCGVEFITDRARKKFCSNKCCGDYYGRIKSEETRKRKAPELEDKRRRAKIRELHDELLKAYKETRYRYEHEKFCKICGRAFIAKSKSMVCCSQVCSRKNDNRYKDKRIYKNGEPDLSINLTKLYKRDNGVCALCGKKISFDCNPQSNDYPSIDHIIPICKGGLHQWDNVQLACRGCNTRKGGKRMIYAPSKNYGQS